MLVSLVATLLCIGFASAFQNARICHRSDLPRSCRLSGSTSTNDVRGSKKGSKGSIADVAGGADVRGSIADNAGGSKEKLLRLLSPGEGGEFTGLIDPVTKGPLVEKVRYYGL